MGNCGGGQSGGCGPTNPVATAEPEPEIMPGIAILLTGLPGAGKSTIAAELRDRLADDAGGRVSVFDGDQIRRARPAPLGFGREDRRRNLLHIAELAREVTASGGVAICAVIAPHVGPRDEMRRIIEPCGVFVLVFVDTPLRVCIERDPKGLYAQARRGLLTGLTGLDDPYDPPVDADLVIRTVQTPAPDAARLVVKLLHDRGLIAPAAPDDDAATATAAHGSPAHDGQRAWEPSAC